jgi:predicted dehydrogenase
MNTMNRRVFLQKTQRTGLGLAAGMTILANPQSARATPANDTVNMAVVGGGGRGAGVIMGFAGRKDCTISHFCDVDPKAYERMAPALAKSQGGKAPVYNADFRKALDDKSVDAVMFALPPHWHALATIWACQAGKDVFCEKPQSQNCWEGRIAVEAARKYNRIVQIGTQNRSAPYLYEAKKYIDSGKLGAIHFVRVVDQGGENNFPMAADRDPPKGFDWDMWNGPAPEHKYNDTLRCRWRYFWRYSGGELSWQGIHQIDVARWLLGLKHPKSVYSHGARYNRDGAAETPDVQTTVFEFDDLMMNVDLTLNTPYMMRADMGVRDGDIYPYWPQDADCITIYGTKALMCVGRMGAGWQVYVREKSRQPVIRDQLHGRFPDKMHQQNFIECVRSRKKPNADIEEGHLSMLLVHYATISYRTGGEKLTIDPASDRIVGNPKAMEYFKREYRKPWVVKEQV